MQTFLPEESFVFSAAKLDRLRLGNQRKEAAQILDILIGNTLHWKNPRAWANHPAVRMWRGYEDALVVYIYAMCDEWRRRGNEDNIGEKVNQLHPVYEIQEHQFPPWLKEKQLYASHRSNLLRKNPEFYGKYGWSEPNDLPYYWPVG